MTLTAYFDESGHDDKLLIMAGFVSTSERWLRFSKECDLIKAYFGIPYIHAAELFNIKSTLHYGHLPLTRRHEAAGALISAIIDHVEFSVTASMIPREFNSLTTKEWRSRYGTAYASCISGILIGLAEYLGNPNGEVPTLSIFLEDGHAHAREAEDVIRDYKVFSDESSDVPIIREIEPQLRIGEHGRSTKEMAPPLWAADLISYCTYRQIVRRDAFCAEIMKAIHSKVPGFGVPLFKEQIQVMVEGTVLGEKTQREWQGDMHGLVRHVYQFGITAHRGRQGVMFDLSAMTPEQKRQFLGDTKDGTNEIGPGGPPNAADRP